VLAYTEQINIYEQFLCILLNDYVNDKQLHKIQQKKLYLEDLSQIKISPNGKQLYSIYTELGKTSVSTSKLIFLYFQSHCCIEEKT